MEVKRVPVTGLHPPEQTAGHSTGPTDKITDKRRNLRGEKMDLAVLIIAFFVLLFLGIPIAIALCASAILYRISP